MLALFSMRLVLVRAAGVPELVSKVGHMVADVPRCKQQQPMAI
jgi:hypothetical protein